MPPPDGRRFSNVWPFFADPNVEVLAWPGEEPSLTDAVASIVGIAAQRAQSSGKLDALRAAVDAALQAAAHEAEGNVTPGAPSAEPPNARFAPR